MSKAKIWALFSVENNYDQPNYNLVAWSSEKPTIENIASWLCFTFPAHDDDTTLAIVNIWSGKPTKIGCDFSHTTYRLEHIHEGPVE